MMAMLNEVVNGFTDLGKSAAKEVFLYSLKQAEEQIEKESEVY